MKMFFLALVILGILPSIVHGYSIESVLETHSVFRFTDGSSVYCFSADGSFLMEPSGLCGRAVEGTWITDDYGVFTIEGLWTWYNGASVPNDRRRMTLTVTLLTEQADSSGGFAFWPVYFTVEEVTPVR